MVKPSLKVSHHLHFHLDGRSLGIFALPLSKDSLTAPGSHLSSGTPPRKFFAHSVLSLYRKAGQCSDEEGRF